MYFLLGVDGGGSKTHAVITDENGRQYGSGLSGCGNHQIYGVKKALKNIKIAIKQALLEARLSPKDIHFTQYGLAGADREKDFSILRPALSKLPFNNWDVVGDTMESLRAGSVTNTGVVLVCGYGTNAAGRVMGGRTIQTGGFDYMFGDAAGGHYMAKETFRTAVRSWEYREEPSILQDMIAEFHGFSDMEEVINHYLENGISRVPAKLTLLLHEAARKEDPVAIRLLQKTGYELGIAANSVIRRLDGFGGVKIPIVLTGSVLQKGKSEHLLQSLQTTIERENSKIEIAILEMTPVYGSILLAMDHLGIHTTEDIMQKFKSYGGCE